MWRSVRTRQHDDLHKRALAVQSQELPRARRHSPGRSSLVGRPSRLAKHEMIFSYFAASTVFWRGC